VDEAADHEERGSDLVPGEHVEELHECAAEELRLWRERRVSKSSAGRYG
jgi:hypothetical protein